MKNITVSVDDETYRRARIRAAELGTSVSELVRRQLTAISADRERFDRLKQLEAAARERIGQFSGSDRLSRDEIHERRR